MRECNESWTKTDKTEREREREREREDKFDKEKIIGESIFSGIFLRVEERKLRSTAKLMKLIKLYEGYS